MNKKEKQALELVKKGMDVKRAARTAGVSPYWLGLKTGKGN